MPDQNYDDGLMASMSLSLLTLPELECWGTLELEGWLDMYDAADMKPTNMGTAAQHFENVAGKLHRNIAYPQLPYSPVPQAAAWPAP